MEVVLLLLLVPSSLSNIVSVNVALGLEPPIDPSVAEIVEPFSLEIAPLAVAVVQRVESISMRA